MAPSTDHPSPLTRPNASFISAGLRMAPSTDHPALLVLGEPPLPELDFELVERRSCRRLDDDINGMCRTDLHRARPGQPQRDGCADEHHVVDQLAERLGGDLKAARCSRCEGARRGIKSSAATPFAGGPPTRSASTSANRSPRGESRRQASTTEPCNGATRGPGGHSGRPARPAGARGAPTRAGSQAAQPPTPSGPRGSTPRVSQGTVPETVDQELLGPDDVDPPQAAVEPGSDEPLDRTMHHGARDRRLVSDRPHGPSPAAGRPA